MAEGKQDRVVLHVNDRRLVQNGVETTLSPKAFHLLYLFWQNSGRLIQTDELSAMIWQGKQVGDTSLKNLVGVLRRALGDTAARPKIIETVRGRGYRLIGTVEVVGDESVEVSWSPAPITLNQGVSETSLVGREMETGLLHDGLKQAQSGECILLVIYGEMGIGKTTLVSNFTAALGEKQDVHFAKGQASEQGLNRETCPLFLDALAHLTVNSAAEQDIEALFKDAPGWLLQLPWLATEQQLETSRRRAAGIGPERSLREIEAIFRILAAERTLVIWLEDIHQAGPQSLEILRHLHIHAADLAILVIATCRFPEVSGDTEPLASLLSERRQQGRLREITLPHLQTSEITQYLNLRAPNFAIPEGLPNSLESLSGGVPLFLKTLVDGWLAGNVRIPLAAETTANAMELPETLQRLLDSQINLLPPSSQNLLSFAAASGRAFSADLVARFIEQPIDLVLRELQELASKTPFFVTEPREPLAAGGKPDYRLAHELYRMVFYDRLSGSQRKSMHHRIAECLAQESGARAHNLAADVSRHYRLAGEFGKAFHFNCRAIEEALAMNLPREALALANEGENLLAEIDQSRSGELKDSDAFKSDSLAFHLLAGTVVSITQGFGDRRAEEHFVRALKLGQKLGRPDAEYHANYGLWTAGLLRGEFDKTEHRTARLEEMAAHSNDEEIWLFTQFCCQSAATHVGDFATARKCSEAIRSTYDPVRFGHHTLRYGIDAGIFAYGQGAWIAALEGRQSDALNYINQGAEVAAALGFPIAQAVLRTFATICHQLRGDVDAVLEAADLALEITHENDFMQWTMITEHTRFWAQAMTGDCDSAIAGLREGIEDWCSQGFGLDRPRFLVMLADAELQAGCPLEAIRTCERALDISVTSGERWQDAEIHRLWAMAESRRRRGSVRRASEHFAAAVRLAKVQGAILWQLRASLDWIDVASGKRQSDELHGTIQSLLSQLKQYEGGQDTFEARRAQIVLGQI